MKRGKKYQDAVKAFDKTQQYDVAEAIALVKKNATAKFDETIELHLRTGCDGRHAEQQIRGAVVLPHGTGKTARVLVFAKGDKATEAEQAGADFVGAEELIPRIEKIIDEMDIFRYINCKLRFSFPQQQITPFLIGIHKSRKSQIHGSESGIHIIMLHGIQTI